MSGCQMVWCSNGGHKTRQKNVPPSRLKGSGLQAGEASKQEVLKAGREGIKLIKSRNVNKSSPNEYCNFPLLPGLDPFFIASSCSISRTPELISENI